MDQVSERRAVDKHSSKSARRLTLVDLPAPFVLKAVKVDGIVSYDIDNAYPSRMERLINSSVTSKSAAGMYARFLSGQGFADESLNTIVVGEENVHYLEIALAGFRREDVEVVTERNVLTVSAKRDADSREYSYRGLAFRSFAKNWQLSDDTIVDGVKYEDGLLTVTLRKVLPEAQQRKVLDIA